MTPEPTASGDTLSNEQLQTAREVGREIHAALHLLLSTFPPDERTAKALAARLEIDGVVARRIVRAANQGDDPLKLLTRLPSVENLRKTQRAAIAKGISPTVGPALLDAVDAFAALIETCGPGKADLTKRLRTTIGVDADDDERT
jgi:hypothetical protein